MIYKKFEWKIVIRVLLLFAVLLAAAFLILKAQYFYLIVVTPIVIYQLYDFYQFHKKTQVELNQFIEAVHYRDFNRYFDVTHAPVEIQPLRQSFNEINDTFRDITKEKETHYQYLQKILELVDTGILSYEIESGTIEWMNESLKKMLQVPYLKSIHSLQKRDADLYQQIISLPIGENKVVDLHHEKNTLKVLLAATAFQTEGKKYRLIAFQNVNEALDETEAKAWQKLLSVLTHEIMNSIAPISSLADTLKKTMQQNKRSESADNSMMEDLELGIETIKRRSEGLLKFAETYRTLNKINTLNLNHVLARDIFENLHTLMEPTLLKKNIQLDIILKDPELALQADTHLIEQVLINLLLNAIEAVKDKAEPLIVISAYLAANNKPIIKVADNGTGMSAEILDKIFVPFFSTKKAGSGIGLSLCKQIMKLHKGNLQVQSKEGEGTAFYLQF